MIEPGSFVLDQPQRHRLRHEEGGAHIEREDGVEILNRHIRQIGRPVHAGIVDQDLVGRALAKRPAHGVDVGDVERKRVGLLPARADGGGGLLDFLRGARDQRDMRAGIGQCGRRGEPDAAPAAGHQRAPAVEAERGGGGEVDSHLHDASCLSLPCKGRVAASASEQPGGVVYRISDGPHPVAFGDHPPPQAGEG